ncbi:hypothetical protein [Bradyrhizobium vignae]|uniref:Uncharacterized protein n=1 Tax=Bradyrhizobium vignae TaxID=1549949 RepID=A0ABS4A6L1_9BRAD|nr:hypothetical protein [Bradyrhizobium vignae]MBP0116048.1 hypothetical protein [Bradyrhizobium vignae]
MGSLRRLCSTRLVVMIPLLLPALERHGTLKLSADERALVFQIRAATIERFLSDVKIAAAEDEGSAFALPYGVHSMTGDHLRRGTAKRIWLRTAACPYPARSFRR